MDNKRIQSGGCFHFILSTNVFMPLEYYINVCRKYSFLLPKILNVERLILYYLNLSSKYFIVKIKNSAAVRNTKV